MPLSAAMLRESFEPERQPRVAHRFYALLFDRYPQVRGLFGKHHSAAKQEEMLVAVLVAMIQHLEDIGWRSFTLKQLGARHAQHGLTDEMYGWVGECLLAALAEVNGPEWTPALAAAWTEAYAEVAALMRIGAASAGAAGAARRAG